jgi:hypothetical protein
VSASSGFTNITGSGTLKKPINTGRGGRAKKKEATRRRRRGGRERRR